MTSFADFQCCIYADVEGGTHGSEKVKIYADVIYGWSVILKWSIYKIFVHPF